MKSTRHPFKWLKYNEQNIRIDKDIAPLISRIWKLGIKTTSSCQEHCSFVCGHKIKIINNYYEPVRTKRCKNHIWIVFASAKDLEKFYNYVAEYSTNHTSLYEYIIRTADKNYHDSIWSLDWVPVNYGIFGHWGRQTINGKRQTYEVWIEDGCDKNNFIMQPQLTFPKKHLKYVEERLGIK